MLWQKSDNKNWQTFTIKNGLFKQFINNGKYQTNYDWLQCICIDWYYLKCYKSFGNFEYL